MSSICVALVQGNESVEPAVSVSLKPQLSSSKHIVVTVQDLLCLVMGMGMFSSLGSLESGH